MPELSVPRYEGEECEDKHRDAGMISGGDYDSAYVPTWSRRRIAPPKRDCKATFCRCLRECDLDVVEDYDGEQTILVDGGPYALTAEGERRVSADEGLVPMWALIAECDGVDPYDCEEFLTDVVYDALVCDGLVYGPETRISERRLAVSG